MTIHLRKNIPRKKKYWSVKDTSLLSLFEWEDYNYSKNLVTVESAPIKWEIKLDENGIKQKSTTWKKSNHYTSQEYLVNDKTLKLILSKYKSDKKKEIECVYINDNLVESNHNANKKIKRSFIFEDSGLLKQIKVEVNDTLKTVREFHYNR